MTEQQDNSGNKAASGGQTASSGKAPPGGADAKSTAAPPPRRGGGTAWLALLLSLTALGLFGWMHQTEKRAKEVEKSAATEVRRQIATLKSTQRASSEYFKGQIASLQTRQQEEFQALQQVQQRQRQQLLELRGTDRAIWSLAEAEYLLRLAHQRLAMASDPGSALSLLTSADTLVQGLDDLELHPVRAALASDMAALRAIPKLDQEGVWLRLQALVGEAERLRLFSLPGQVEVSGELRGEDGEPPAPTGWTQRLRQSLGEATGKLSSYILIQRREAPFQPLLEPQWEGLVRQNLRLLLEQAQAGLLSGNQKLYDQGIAAGRGWLGEFFSIDEAAVAAMDAELADLARLQVEREYPDIDRSVAALRQAINARERRGEKN